MNPPSAELGARFLAEPGRVPPRAVDDAGCGAETLCIDFAGGPYLFTGLSVRQSEAVARRFAGLCRPAEDDCTHTVSTRVVAAPDGTFRDPQFRGEDYYFDSDFSANSVRLAGWNFCGVLQREPELRGQLWARPADDLVRYGVFENYFRVLVANRLLTAGGVLLHSGAVVDAGRAHVFFGRSGAGKSTISRLGAQTGREVLSDDLNALIIRGDEVWCRKIPFAGDFGATPGGTGDAYPVAGLYSLRQHERNALRPLSSAEAIVRLLVCAPFVNSDTEHGERLMMNLERILARLPVQELSFLPDAGVWAMLAPSQANASASSSR